MLGKQKGHKIFFFVYSSSCAHIPFIGVFQWVKSEKRKLEELEKKYQTEMAAPERKACSAAFQEAR